MKFNESNIKKIMIYTCGKKKRKKKRKVRQTLKDHKKDQLTVILDTYESQLEDEAHIEKLNEFKGYIFNHWDYIPDWRTRIKHSPSDARGLGAMESNQRRITFRMKKRDRKSTRLNSSHVAISYACFCLK